MNKQLEIVNFSGGINDVIEPHLLDLQFSTNLKNCLINNGAIISQGDLSEADPTDSELLYQTGERSILKWANQYYWTDNVSGDMNSTLGYLGVEAARNNIVAADGEAGGRFEENKTYKYFYTYRTADSFRGAPFDLSDHTEYTAPSGGIGSVLISGFFTDLPQYVSHMEIWRTLADGAEFYLAGEVSRFAGDTIGDIIFEDKVLDIELLLNEKYELSNPDIRPEIGKYFCEKNSVFYLAVGEKVYFSKQSNPHSFPALQYVVMDDTITGMIAFEDYILVATINRPYILRGDSLADISKEELPDAQGVLNWKTINRVKNMPVWVSNDGLCAYVAFDQRSGRKIQVLTENIFDLPANPLSAAVANEIYYLFYETETIAFDFKQNMKVTRLDWVLDWAWYNKSTDQLIGKKNEVYKHAGGGDTLEFEYVSPELTMGDMQLLKQPSRLYVDSNCDLLITFFIDGVERWSFTSSGNGYRRHFLQAGLNGRRVQIKIQGTGELRGIKLDYAIRRM